MHREIRAFWQHIYGILATIGHSCDVLGHFRNIEGIFVTLHRAFLPHLEIILSATRPGSEVGYISFNSALSWSDEAGQSKSNKDLTVLQQIQNNFYPDAGSFVGKCSFCRDILY